MGEDSRRVEWDSEAYDRLSDPQFGWGMRILASIALRGNETVLDAGCGSGRLSSELLARLPAGRVIALDSSANMLRTAARRLSCTGDRVRFMQASLDSFSLESEVDGIFSNAVFHWVPDHDAMFRCLFRALRPSGWLVAQFGGEGNLARLRARFDSIAEQDPYREYLTGWSDGAHYESQFATEARLQSAGFIEIETETHPAPVQFPDMASMSEFVQKVNAHRIVSRLPERLRESFVAEALKEFAHDRPPFTLDYVRLTVRARKPQP